MVKSTPRQMLTNLAIAACVIALAYYFLGYPAYRAKEATKRFYKDFPMLHPNMACVSVEIPDTGTLT